MGGLIGAVSLDLGRALIGSTEATFMFVFAAEALLFVAAASLALRAAPRRTQSQAAFA
jgi:BCD family chlorophyll transporter-like MFS transporter